jgi:hypothetical protein
MSAEHSADPGQVSPFRKSKIVMRIGLIVVGLSTLTIMELGTPSRTKSAPDPFDQLMIDASASPDTLETADRLEMHQLQHEARFPPVSLAESPSDVSVRAPRNSSTFEFGANNRKEDVVGTLKPKNTDKTRPTSHVRFTLSSLFCRTSWRRGSAILRRTCRCCLRYGCR